ncbi:MAG: type VI secretion system tip protein VgrG [Planctomycetaceae bacterium]|nr:type VI secretion system tip protein VgrG [Planctomycetaceae bacterium]
MVLTQQERMLKLSTPLGKDVLLLTGFSGQEEISRLFRFQLEMISDNNAIAAAQIVGQNVTFSVELSDGSPRFFNGFVNQFVAGDEHEGRRNYRAEVVPWLWFLTQTADCRLFQDKTIKDIIETIFGDLGFSDYKFDLRVDHKKWEYCVQYRETDFNFVSRLLEQEGVSYWFKHADGKHEMVISDHKGAYYELTEKEVEYPPSVGSVAIADHITSWEHCYEFRPGKWAQTDYNFKTPSTSLMSNEPSVVSLPGIDKYEIYDYPGEYPDKGVGKTETKLRIEEEEVPHDVVQASSQCKSFSPGGKFKIAVHRSSSEEGKSFAVTKIRHSATEPMAYETGAAVVGSDYTNSFSCIPDSVVFRPARITPKPLVSGLQTAVVVGPKGEEIYTDSFGRIKVQFHWDREGKRDENSSCWMRCMQPSAGRQWGTVFIPRIGQEVVIDFLEGDPDRPLVTGLVYNAEQMPHYKLPDDKTKSYIKTNSTPGGDGFNELMFEDKADDERVFIHAEKNMDVRVKNDSKSRIYGNRHQIIGWEKDGKKGGNQHEMVWQDKHLNIKRHQVEHIEGNHQWMVGNGEADDGGNVDIVIEKKKTEQIDGGSDLTITGTRREKVNGAMSLTVAGALHTKSGDDIQIESGAANEIHLKAGMKIIIEAGMQISLVGPGGFVDIGPAGVTIQGITVKINSGGAAGSGKPCKPEVPEAAKPAEPAAPAQAHNSTTGVKSAPD